MNRNKRIFLQFFVIILLSKQAISTEAHGGAGGEGIGENKESPISSIQSSIGLFDGTTDSDFRGRDLSASTMLWIRDSRDRDRHKKKNRITPIIPAEFYSKSMQSKLPSSSIATGIATGIVTSIVTPLHPEQTILKEEASGETTRPREAARPRNSERTAFPRREAFVSHANPTHSLRAADPQHYTLHMDRHSQSTGPFRFTQPNSERAGPLILPYYGLHMDRLSQQQISREAEASLHGSQPKEPRSLIGEHTRNQVQELKSFSDNCPDLTQNRTPVTETTSFGTSTFSSHPSVLGRVGILPAQFRREHTTHEAKASLSESSNTSSKQKRLRRHGHEDEIRKPETVLEVSHENESEFGSREEPETDPSCMECDCGIFSRTASDLRGACYPPTLRKALWWSFLSALITTIIVTEIKFDWGDDVADWVRRDMLLMMIFSYGIEPAAMMFTLIFGPYPDPEKGFSKSHKSKNALVIPVYKNAENIGSVLEAALHHFNPEDIFIIDNANSATPTDNCKDVVKAIHSEINYFFVPKGNKTIAQYVGTKMAKESSKKNYKYITTTDDDVIIPQNWKFPTHLLNHETGAVCIPIQARAHGGCKGGLLVRSQNLEYGLAEHSKTFENRIAGGVFFLHGAASYWKIDTFLEALHDHNTRFQGEDMQLGMCLQRKGIRLALSAHPVITMVPETVFGQGGLFAQRFIYWEVTRHHSTAMQARSLCWGRKTIGETIAMKCGQCYGLLSNVADWMRVPVIVICADLPDFWWKLAAIQGGSLALTLLWNDFKAPKDRRVSIPTLLVRPFYKMMTDVFGMLGGVRALIISGPSWNALPTIGELESIGQIPEPLGDV